MSIKSSFADFFSKHMIEPFVEKPGMKIPESAIAERFTVKGGLTNAHWQESFVQARGGQALSEKTGKALDMTPAVKGGFQEGDIVFRGNSAFCTAESGWVASLLNFFKTGHWKIERARVSHVAMIARDPAHANDLRVIQMVSGDTPKDLVPLLTPMQRRLKATFLRNDSLNDFFNNAEGRPFTDTAVVRPTDSQLAHTAAEKALADYNGQVVRDASGKVVATHPWYSKLTPGISPDHRGGVCSDFVNRAFGGKFDEPIAVTPFSIEHDPAVKLVGETQITAAEQLAAVPPVPVAK